MAARGSRGCVPATATKAKPLEEQLVDAVIADNASRVKTLVKRVADVDTLVVVRNGIVERQELLKANALYTACQMNHTEVVKLLLKARASVSVSSSEGFLPLTIAAQEGHCSCIRLLLDAKADVNANKEELCFSTGRAALRLAVANCKMDAAKVLLTAGADADAADNHGFTALHAATMSGDTEMVKLLLDAGAPPDVRSACGRGMKPIDCTRYTTWCCSVSGEGCLRPWYDMKKGPQWWPATDGPWLCDARPGWKACAACAPTSEPNQGVGPSSLRSQRPQAPARTGQSEPKQISAGPHLARGLQSGPRGPS